MDNFLSLFIYKYYVIHTKREKEKVIGDKTERNIEKEGTRQKEIDREK
jgi:hypothetical protein